MIGNHSNHVLHKTLIFNVTFLYGVGGREISLNANRFDYQERIFLVTMYINL